ncbi:hypothetical protein B0H12DRAFT_46715 [Mycena haematopus]|nr:hypothetical protein B0H12DRAFT_46715 [Mycena haematopus]
MFTSLSLLSRLLSWLSRFRSLCIPSHPPRLVIVCPDAAQHTRTAPPPCTHLRSFLPLLYTSEATRFALRLPLSLHIIGLNPHTIQHFCTYPYDDLHDPFISLLFSSRSHTHSHTHACIHNPSHISRPISLVCAHQVHTYL